ncbi:MAG TPA: hypothetical protein VFG71_10775 [Nitrospiraceae bacterium]|nr:hypothetical protein [Nitrospiraceae bacterium]
MNPKVWLLVITVLGLITVPSASQKPVRESTDETYWIEPPADLRQMLRSADAVFTGSVGSRKGRFVPGVGGTKRIITDYVFDVDEVFKSNGPVGVAPPNVRVIALGGQVDAGDHIERKHHKGWKELKHGRRFIVFVKWNAYFNGYVFQYGPNGILEEISGKTVAFASAGAPQALDGLEWSETLVRLREASRQAGLNP